MSIWKNKDSGPIFQLIHFTFAIGAFLAPIIARHFITDDQSAQSNNVTITCIELLNHSTDMYNDECYRQMITNCTSMEGSGMMDLVVLNDCHNIVTVSTTFRYAFWVASIPLLPSLIGLIYYAIKEQCCCDLRQLMMAAKRSKNDTNIKDESDKKDDIDEKDQPLSYPDTIVYKSTLLILLFTLILLYVGAEVTYGTYIFAYAVKSDLNFSKEKATIISSVFWGTFAFFRFFSITLSLCKVSPSIMLTTNLTGSLIASLIVVIGATNEIAMWIGSALLGISFASIYPNIVNWLIRHGPATGKATSVLSAGAVIGDMSLPVLVGVLIDKVGPISLCYFTLANIIVCCVTFAALFVIAYKCRVKEGENYYQLQHQVEEVEELIEMKPTGDDNNNNNDNNNDDEVIKCNDNNEEDKLELLLHDDHQNI